MRRLGAESDQEKEKSSGAASAPLLVDYWEFILAPICMLCLFGFFSLQCSRRGQEVKWSIVGVLSEGGDEGA